MLEEPALGQFSPWLFAGAAAIALGGVIAARLVRVFRKQNTCPECRFPLGPPELDECGTPWRPCTNPECRGGSLRPGSGRPAS